jgi:hypothetical protein
VNDPIEKRLKVPIRPVLQDSEEEKTRLREALQQTVIVTNCLAG